MIQTSFTQCIGIQADRHLNIRRLTWAAHAGKRNFLEDRGGHGLKQWYSTWGTRTLGDTRRLKGYVKFKKKILFHDKHLIIRARFRVSHRRPGRKNIRFGKAISLSLSLSFM
jgi:hypothetical protein